MRTLHPTLIVVAFAWHSVQAGPLEPMTFRGQVQQSMNEGRVNACGVRLVGLPDVSEGAIPPTLHIVDVSANISLPGFAAVKGGVRTARTEHLQSTQTTGRPEPKTLTIERIWVRGKGGAATQQSKASKAIKAETPGSLLYVADVEPAMQFLGSVLADETVQVGFKVAGEGVERIYYGRVQLDLQDREQFNACMDDLLKAGKAETPPR